MKVKDSNDETELEQEILQLMQDRLDSIDLEIGHIRGNLRELSEWLSRIRKRVERLKKQKKCKN